MKTTIQNRKKGSGESIIYLGPTIKGVAQSGTVFNGGTLTGEAKTAINRFPSIERLFVPLSDLPQAVRELKSNQSVLSTIYRKTREFFMKEDK